MAVETPEEQGVPAAPKRFSIGANVVAATVLVVAIVAVLQTIAYSVPGGRWDMTSSRINSLSDATTRLLRNLDTPVTLTSLYFETDLEEEDQPLYRQTVGDLLGLYESTQRSKVTADRINPLRDHEKFNALTSRLRAKERFQKEIGPYQEAVDRYGKDLYARVRDLIQSEIERINSLSGPMGGGAPPPAVGQVQSLFTRLTAEVDAVHDQIDALTSLDVPQLAAAVNVLKSHYRDISKALEDIPRFAQAELARNPEMPGAAADYLRESGGRYAQLVGEIESQTTALQKLEPLKIDDILRALSPNSNAIIVETDSDAMVVDFGSVWPAMEQGAGARARFKDRAFKGEEKLTSAILRATHKEQTAVVFVRYGGAPLFFSGGLPGQPPMQAPYAAMKQRLEDSNFVVGEWDLKSSETEPVVDPPPTRTVYVVLKPTPPQRGPMGRPGPEPPFGESQRKTLLDALGKNGRALFIAGWAPGPFGPIPSTYEYGEYLKDSWGIEVDTSSLLIRTVNFEPGKYAPPPRDPNALIYMDDLDVTDHPIVSGSQARQLTLPFCAPLLLSDPPPDGVSFERLVVMPKRDTIWGVKNIQTYQGQLSEQGFMSRAAGDTLGPFDLAVAATKGDARMVVVSAREFATDPVAFAQEFAMSAQGFTVRSRNPGNVTLMLNALHWLNDSTEFLNIGQPIDVAVLEINHKSTQQAVQALTIFVWPALALVGGGIAWWTRRR